MSSPATQSRFFATGGTMPLNAPSYIRRQADEELYQYLSEGKFCYVLDSRQVGKSSLMVRAKERLRAEGVTVAQIDLQSIGQNVTVEQWYGSLVTQLGDELLLGDDLYDFFEDARKQERFGPLERWIRTLTEVVLQRCGGQIVIFVDEIDQVRTLQSRFSTDEFFTGIRELYNRRSSSSELKRLTFCLIGCATPSDLIKDVRTTPFNIGQRIELTDFTPTEAASLAKGLGREEKVAQVLLERISHWTGGHPYLTQRFCQEVANRREIRTPADIDRLGEELYFSSRARLDDHNLKFVNDKIHEAADLAGLLDLYRRVRRDKPVVDDQTNPLINIMRLSGITRIAQGYHYVRNRIYYRVFDRQWIRQNMPGAEIRRQRVAAIKAALLTSAAALVILAILSNSYFVRARLKETQAEEALSHAEAEKANLEKEQSDENRRALAQTLETEHLTKMVGARRERADHLNSMLQMTFLTDQLLSYSAPEQKARWLPIKGQMLIQQGNLRDAETAFNSALELDPDAMIARMSRGYVHLLLKHPKEALSDFDYVRDHIDAKNSLNYLDRTIVLAQLGNYQAAQASLKEAMRNWLYGQFDTVGDPQVSPDITRATDRTKLFLDAQTFEAALHFMEANLEAYIGDTQAFLRALSDAEQKGSTLPPASRDNVHLIAINWAWFQNRFRQQDYGALASQAALWKEANYPEWAGCYFEEFLNEHRQYADKRYFSLAKWVEREKAALPFSDSCRNLREKSGREPGLDISALELDASEKQAAGQLREAEAGFDRALGLEPQNIRVLLKKAAILFELSLSDVQRIEEKMKLAHQAQEQVQELESQLHNEGALSAWLSGLGAENQEPEPNMATADKKKHYQEEVQKRQELQATYEAESKHLVDQARKDLTKLEADCDRILKIDPRTPLAHSYRAAARFFLKSSSASNKTALEDILAAIDSEPSNQLALSFLHWFVPPPNSPEAVPYLERYKDYLERYTRLHPAFDPTAYLHLAILANHQKRYLDALQLSETTIGIQRENLEAYEIRAEAERALGLDESQVKHRLAEGFHQAGDALRMHGDTAAANAAYQKGWQTIAELGNNNKADKFRCDSTLATCIVTRIIEAPHSEEIHCRILATATGDGPMGEARIDKGIEDGIMVGSRGYVYSHYSKSTSGHERRAVKIGTGEVVSAGSDFSVLRVTMDSPSGDGVVREDDMVRLHARTPLQSRSSQLWSLAKYNVTLLGRNGRKILDYRTFYSNETPELDNKVFQTLLNDIHDTGRLQRLGEAKVIEEGIFKGQTLAQALESTTLNHLERFLAFALKYPANYSGRQWKISDIYAVWLNMGTPSD